MNSSKPHFKMLNGVEVLKDRTNVTWHYRSAIGHGTIKGIQKMGASHSDTMYNIEQHDYHVSTTGSHEPTIVRHYGKALTVVEDTLKTKAA